MLTQQLDSVGKRSSPRLPRARVKCIRGRDSRLEREVAIKVRPESFATDRDRMARFERLIELSARKVRRIRAN